MTETPTTRKAKGDTVSASQLTVEAPVLKGGDVIRAQRVGRQHPHVFRVVDPQPLSAVRRPEGWTIIEASRIYNYGKPYVDPRNIGENQGREIIAILETDSIERLSREV
jgi:hypothetical protein